MRVAPLIMFVTAMTASAAQATTVRVHYDAGQAGAAGSMTVRADKGPMSWSRGAAAQRVAGLSVWTYTWPDALGDITMKPVLGGDKISTGGAYKLAAGSTVDIYPFFGAPFGKLTIVPDFASTQLGNQRKLRVYLPASYQENLAKRYPVIYMHDAQNLFDANTAAYGVEWGIDETVNRLVATGVMDEVIVVGIDNTPGRIAEYTPCCDPKYGGGKLDEYQRFVLDTVKPHVDKTWRTLPGREHTAVMGSSLGGIASMVMAQRHSAVFSKAAAVSGSFWWDQNSAVTRPAARVPVKFYLDAGTRDDGMAETLLMRDAMVRQGYKLGDDLMFYSADGAGHNEKSWAARVDKPLTFFFPWGSTRQ